MKVTYLKLENVAGLKVGSKLDSIEIDFSKSINSIIAILGENGKGKTVLLSSITPFANLTSVDDRSNLSYIIPKKDGYKEIHYKKDDNEYIIKHYYKAKGEESHTVKSYFSLNGEELNENGNVTSFLSLVESHFGLTQEMMRLVRLGTNVNSFVTLTPTRRKEYIGKLIEEIDIYMNIYKNINDEIRVIKTLISSNNSNLYNCHISDILTEEEELKRIGKDIKKSEKEKDKLVGDIEKLRSLISNNNIEDLRRKKSEAESSIIEFNKVSDKIQSLSLEDVSVDKLINQRSNLSEERINIQSKINSYRISIDNTLKNIERLEVNIKRITSDNDIQSLISAIEDLKDEIKSTNKIIVEDFKPYGNSKSDDIQYVINKLSSFNQISHMIMTFGNRPIEIYLKVRSNNDSVDKWLKKQAKDNLSRYNETDIRSLLDQVFGNDEIISPNCLDEFRECPYYRLSEVINGIRDKLEEESYDDETLRYIQIISNNIDNILNELDKLKKIDLPDHIREIFNIDTMLNRLKNKLPFFDLTDINEYLSMMKEYEIYIQRKEKLKEYEYQLSIYKKSGIENHLAEIKEQQDNITFYKSNIATLNVELDKLTKALETIDNNIALVTKYNDGKKYQKILISSLESANKILEPLENASTEKMELDYELKTVVNRINDLRESHKQLENRINEYKRLIKEGEKLQKKFNQLDLILKATSTKKGIPVIFIKRYLGKIKNLANNLLDIIYDGEFQLTKFNISQDSFEIPYVKNGRKIYDIKYASQSEVALATMALSFALANMASGDYNIILLDEMDAGLDETNRAAFLRMLHTQMSALNTEQVFIISHNMTQMINIPMDCIKLNDTGNISKLQNVIYENK